MNQEAARHIQFLVFEGLNPDFSTLSTGETAVLRFWLLAQEIAHKEIFPAMKDDILICSGQTPNCSRPLDWIP